MRVGLLQGPGLNPLFKAISPRCCGEFQHCIIEADHISLPKIFNVRIVGSIIENVLAGGSASLRHRHCSELNHLAAQVLGACGVDADIGWTRTKGRPQRRSLAVEWLAGGDTGELVGGGPIGGLRVNRARCQSHKCKGEEDGKNLCGCVATEGGKGATRS